MIFATALSRIFYTAHTTFFLGLIFFCFGFMGGNEHKAIAGYIAVNPVVCGWLLLVWAVYVIYCSWYLTSLLMKPTTRVLRNHVLLPNRIQIPTIGLAVLTVLLPMLLYVWFILFFAFQHSLEVTFMLLGFTVLSVLLPTLWLRTVLRGPIQEGLSDSLVPSLKVGSAKPYFMWYIGDLLRKPVMLLLTKFVSLLFAVAIGHLYFTDAYDWRLLALAMLIICGIHTAIVKHYLQFHFEANRWLLNMPRSWGQMFFSTSATFLLIILPDWLVLVRYVHRGVLVWQLIEVLFFGYAMITLFSLYGSRFLKDYEPFFKHSFYLSVTLVFAIMFSTPLWITAAVLLSLAIFLQRKMYMRIPEVL